MVSYRDMFKKKNIRSSRGQDVSLMECVDLACEAVCPWHEPLSRIENVVSVFVRKRVRLSLLFFVSVSISNHWLVFAHVEKCVSRSCAVSVACVQDESSVVCEEEQEESTIDPAARGMM